MRAQVAPEIIRPSRSAGAEQDLNHALELLDEVRQGKRADTIRIYRPEPTMAFGQRDTRLPGFERAYQAAAAQGFTPLVRKAGGRAMPYHRGCLVVDWIQAESDAILGSQKRFGRFGEWFTELLTELNVPAALGEIPGEYCPGEYSVHGTVPEGLPRAEERVKLVGTAQRVVSGAWLFSAAVVVQGTDSLRQVLIDCYRELGLEWDPGTVGAAVDLNPAVTVADTEAAILEKISRRAVA
ncbi:lipoate--protein ligase family protein [Acaricomes phytoseiuli]|uniref:lipoate--protein ligase family protein n=1 Tax=Acaricomes phytoseiuli TaxID=291968 RepID=UPI00036F6E43|nr:lipoate--protein ligase family protein [Acaricomes phytoseiuli]MCW1249320.1 lipoate--protein ligase family protein [Acaricomes phytoseiuli]